jgi:hypothetical protein
VLLNLGRVISLSLLAIFLGQGVICWKWLLLLLIALFGRLGHGILCLWYLRVIISIMRLVGMLFPSFLFLRNFTSSPILLLMLVMLGERESLYGGRYFGIAVGERVNPLLN